MTSQTSRISQLRRLVALMTSVVGIALILLTALQVEWDKRQALSQHVEEMENLSTALTRQAESTIRDAHTVMIGIERKLSISGYGAGNLDEVLQITRAQLGALRDLEGFTVIDRDGRLLMSTLSHDLDGVSALDRDFFNHHLHNPSKNLYIGKPIQSRLSGEWVIPLSLRLSDADGSFHGVVLGGLLVQRFIDLYQTIDLGNEGIISLVKRDGSTLARSKMAQQSFAVSLSSSPVLRMINEEGVVHGNMTLTALVDGVRRIYGFDSSSAYPILIAAAVSEQEALQPWRHRAYQTWALSVMLVLVCIIMAWLIWRALVRQGEMEAGLQGMHQDLTAANRALEIIAGEDALTGLANRRGLDEALHTAFRNAASTGQVLSFVLIDVDYFKRFNDQYGHLKGDEALTRVAHALRHLTRRSLDTTARYGGEELALVLPGADQPTAARIAEKVRVAVEALQIDHQGSPYGTLTVSIGVATCVPGRDQPDSKALVAAADIALYAAKEAGRNRVRISDHAG